MRRRIATVIIVSAIMMSYLMSDYGYAQAATQAREDADGGGKLNLDKLKSRSEKEGPGGNAFKPKSWQVVAPPVVKKAEEPAPPPPPPPSAPKLPYVYIGSIRDQDGNKTIFLAKDEQVYPVREGDMLDGVYKIGSVNDGQLIIIYLPLNIEQSLSVGEIE